MKIAFAHANRGFYGTLIAWWTRSKYEHTEIIFEKPIFIAFSSDEQSHGTRLRYINNLTDDKAWTILTIPDEYTEGGKEALAFDYTEKNLLGLPYDWKDIASFLFHNINPSKDKAWICSAVCLRVIQELGLFRDVRCQDTSPELLYELISSIQPVMSMTHATSK